jgi:hypothetical protein
MDAVADSIVVTFEGRLPSEFQHAQIRPAAKANNKRDGELVR